VLGQQEIETLVGTGSSKQPDTKEYVIKLVFIAVSPGFHSP
jgi:hypothetical protein